VVDYRPLRVLTQAYYRLALEAHAGLHLGWCRKPADSTPPTLRERPVWGFVSALSVVFLWLFLCTDGHSKLLSTPCLLKEIVFAQDRSDHGCCAAPVLYCFCYVLRHDVRRHILEGNGVSWVIYQEEVVKFLRDCLAHGFLICCSVKNGVNAGEDLQRRAVFAEHVGSCLYPQGGT
jgi:hypothetical protein